MTVQTDQPIVRFPMRVRYHECDAQGVVFNANYLTYADVAFTEAARALFGSWHNVVERGIDVVAAEANVRYRGASRFDDELEIDVITERLGTTSMVLRFDIRNGSEVVNEVTTRYVWVDRRTLRPHAPPADIRDAFARHLVAHTEPI